MDLEEWLVRKRLLLATAAAASLVMLTGCLADTYPLTEGEQDIIAEYAAGVLLRSDENYTQALNSPIPTPSPEPTPTLTPAPQPTEGGGKDKDDHGGKGDNTEVVENASLNEVFGLEGLTVEYEGYELYGVLEENGGYVVKPGKGNMLMRVAFTLTNTAGIEQEFAFAEQGINYRLDCGEKNVLSPKITGMEGDMLFMKVTLAAGESCDAYVIFELKERAKPVEGKVIVSRDGEYTSIVVLE